MIKENFGNSCDARALMNLQRIERKNIKKKKEISKEFCNFNSRVLPSTVKILVWFPMLNHVNLLSTLLHLRFHF